jgi:hypothetical protein
MIKLAWLCSENLNYIKLNNPTNSAITLSIVNQISTCKVLLELQVVNNLIANSLKLMVTFSVVNKLSKFIVLDMTQIIPWELNILHIYTHFGWQSQRNCVIVFLNDGHIGWGFFPFQLPIDPPTKFFGWITIRLEITINYIQK